MEADKYVDVLEVFEGRDGWRYRGRSSNRETEFVSEGYNDKSTAVQMAAALAAQLGVPVSVRGGDD